MTDRLLDEFLAGRPAALARAVSVVENHRPGFDKLLGAVHSRIGRARRVGLTGPPGAGKSTLTARIARSYREQGLTVGVLAVDPTSPYTGGALLGDRVRMEEIALDRGVYIRSLATRGALGGLSAATREVADLLDAFGFDRILIETVGVGQSELEVARTADTIAVVLVPESGDGIQALKAGLMEIADVFVINKADRPGADRLKRDIDTALHYRPPAVWTPPVIPTVGVTGMGLTELLAALDRHHQYLVESGTLAARRQSRLRERVVDVVDQRLKARVWDDPSAAEWLAARLAPLAAGETTPFAVADELLERQFNKAQRGHNDDGHA
ncbi:MAG TPA: methylmalonyl Co-A mutase-associated GTPase MeaB [Gemmatimonadaceae bacterium]|jgi:LAO/AO transport system kinase|nr:methylmalonyl Co-A mutase-associated GTPase MeaB [Gemmatimonadaceae bacterium]